MDRVITLVEEGKSEYLGQLSIELQMIPKLSLADFPRVGTATSTQASSVARNLHQHSTNAANDGSSIRGRSGSTFGDSISLASGASAQTEKKKLKTGDKWTAIVSIILIEGKDLLAMDIEGTSDPYCKFR